MDQLLFLILLLSLILPFTPVSPHEDPKGTPKVAIIGGGIGGTATAFFLQELFGRGKLQVDLYEPEVIGGRLATINVGGRSYEMGGSIIHSQNKYMISFAKKFGLKQKLAVSGSRMGLWNGSMILFEESSWEGITLLKLLWRYGLGPMKLHSYTEDMLSKFENIYSLQSEGDAFWTVSDMLKAMDVKFDEFINVKTATGFKNLGFSDAVIDELIASTIRVNYGQDTSVHQFVGLVSVAAATGHLWSVHGGNFHIPLKLLEASEATLIKDRIIKISPYQDGKLLLSSQSSLSSPKEDRTSLSQVYDFVVLAVPLYNNSKHQIDLSEFSDKGWTGNFHHTVSTVLQGHLNHSFFGYEKDDPAPDEIFATKGGLFYNSVGKIHPVDLQEKKEINNVWKVFSPKPLLEDELKLLFVKYDENSVQVKDWLAYPDYAELPQSDSFCLHQNLFYVNAIEWAASAMEMSVIGAKNVALLVHKSVVGEPSQSASYPKPMNSLKHSDNDEL